MGGLERKITGSAVGGGRKQGTNLVPARAFNPLRPQERSRQGRRRPINSHTSAHRPRKGSQKVERRRRYPQGWRCCWRLALPEVWECKLGEAFVLQCVQGDKSRADGNGHARRQWRRVL